MTPARVVAPLVEVACIAALVPLYAFVAVSNLPKALRLFSSRPTVDPILAALAVEMFRAGPDAATAMLVAATDEAFAEGVA